jgi:hypothetical protein
VTPIIREFEELTEDDEGLVPGGFLYYILMDHAPGIQLNHAAFWTLDYGERDRIRGAFCVAWEYVASSARSLADALTRVGNRECSTGWGICGAEQPVALVLGRRVL